MVVLSCMKTTGLSSGRIIMSFPHGRLPRSQLYGLFKSVFFNHRLNRPVTGDAEYNKVKFHY